MKVFVITGCTSKDNLGYKIAKEIFALIPNSHIIGITAQGFDENTSFNFFDSTHDCDLSSAESVCDLVDEISLNQYVISYGIYAIINAAGYNKLQWFDEKFDWIEHEKILDINFTAPCAIVNKLIPELELASGTVLNIISMGAVKPFRSSFSYNTSKAALKMATHQLARELSSKQITVFGISPNELEGTNMTNEIRKQIETIRGWSPEQAEAYRLAGTLTPKLTSPDLLAEFIAHILQSKDHHHHFTGCDIPYGI